MRRSQRIASMVAVVPFAAMMWACGGAEHPDKPATSPATNKATAPANANTASSANTNTANANAAATDTAMAIPADVKTVFTAKCAACHGADATGGPAAPNIFKVKDTHTEAEWLGYLKNPKSLDTDSKMPAVAGTDAELKPVASWLASTTGKGAAK